MGNLNMRTNKNKKTTFRLSDVNSLAELGIKREQKSKISSLFRAGFGARAISEETNIPRRRVMKSIEMMGLHQYSEGSYA